MKAPTARPPNGHRCNRACWRFICIIDNYATHKTALISVPIDATIADQDYAVLAHTLSSDAAFAGKRIVVCWHHGNIPSLMHALGAASGDYPDPWHPGVFNLILEIDYSLRDPSVTKVTEPF